MRARDVRARMLTTKLLEFYTPELFRLLRDIIGRKTGVSLRIIDWFTTSYARRHQCSYVLGEERIIVYNEYKAMLKSYQKTCFDPFCRRTRVYIDTRECLSVHAPAGGDVIETTNGQLNFFRWAISRGVLLYAGTIIGEIERDLAYNTRSKCERQREPSILFAAATCVTFGT
jgi:hypothetical protein